MKSFAFKHTDRFSKKPLLFTGTLGLLALLTIGMSGCGKKEEETAVKTVVRPIKMLTIAEAAKGSVQKYPGRVRADRRVDLAFKVAGPLFELPVEEGQLVNQKELIARIDPRDFKTDLAKIESDIKRANSQLKAMQVGARPEDIEILKAEVEATQARLLNAEQQYQRYRELYIQRQVSKADFDRYKSERDVARAQLNTAKQNLVIGQRGARIEDVNAKKAEIRGLQARRKRLQDALNDTYLKAPFTGVIARRYVENFEEVRAKQPIVSLQDISRLEILIDVPENVMATLKARGDAAGKAVAEFATVPGEKFSLDLKEFSTEADSLTQTYRVTLIMNQPPDANILPGMTAIVTGTTYMSDTNAVQFVIPAIAVFSDQSGDPFVWIVDPKTMKAGKRSVKTGELTGKDSIYIEDGLKPGETIAISGVSQLREGMKVSDLSKLEGYQR
jgi:RND family efflux transporter MFP subunit